MRFANATNRRHWLHNYSISLIRPFLFIRPNALDKAVLFWLNYRNTYNCWAEERNKLIKMSGRREKGENIVGIGKQQEKEIEANSKMDESTTVIAESLQIA